MPIEMGLKTKGLATVIRGTEAMSRLSAAKRRVELGKEAVEVVRVWQQGLSGAGSSSRLGIRTGEFRRKIRVGKVTADVAIIGTDHPGARIHEFGGTIRAKRAPFLVFAPDPAKPKELVFVKQVKIPPRPHRKPAAKRASPKVRALRHRFIRRELDRAYRPKGGE